MSDAGANATASDRRMRETNCARQIADGGVKVQQAQKAQRQMIAAMRSKELQHNDDGDDDNVNAI